MLALFSKLGVAPGRDDLQAGQEIAPISVCTSRIVALVGPSIGVPGPSLEYCVRDLLFLRLK